MLKPALLVSIAIAVLPSLDAHAARERDRDANDIPSVMQFTLTPLSNADRAQFSLSFNQGQGRSQSSDAMRWNDFDGITRADVAGAAAHAVSFRIAREAGAFTCTGIAGANTASGSCRFAANTAFAAALAQRGVGRPSEGQLYYLTLGNFHMATLDELDRQGYARPDIDDVVQSSLLDVDAAYVRGIAQAGYRLGTLDRLTEFHIHGVTPDYIAELSHVDPAFVHLSPDDLMQLGIAGVTPAFVSEMRTLGYTSETPEDYSEMKLFGADAAYVRELRTLGYRDIASDDLVQAAIFGVDGDFIRGMREAGYARLTLEELVDLRIHDVTPHYAARINAARSGRRADR